MKSKLTRIATVAVLGGALLVVVARNRDWRISSISHSQAAGSATDHAATPENAIYKMIDAARLGDVQGYLECYSGVMKDQLRQSVRETTEEKFARYLRDTNAAIKGIAISMPEMAGDRQARVRVEYVYADRNEVQFMVLNKFGSAWKIIKVNGAERIETLVPYGAPVTD